MTYPAIETSTRLKYRRSAADLVHHMTNLLVLMTSTHYMLADWMSSMLVIFLASTCIGRKYSWKLHRAWHHYGRRLVASDLRRLQKVVISRRIRRDVVYSLRVHDHVVEKPEVDVGKVIGQDSLDFGIHRLAPAGIGFRAALF